jgi:hypothetical protein
LNNGDLTFKSSSRERARNGAGDGGSLDSPRASEREDNNKSPPPLNSHRSATRNSMHPGIQIQQTSPRTLPDKPPTPYEDRVIPTLRNTNKSRAEKKYPDGTDYNEDEQLNNSGGGSSSREDGGGGVGAVNDSIVPDQQQQQQEFEQEMYDPMDGTEEMTEREVREAALMNDYLGKQIVRFLRFYNYTYCYENDPCYKIKYSNQGNETL